MDMVGKHEFDLSVAVDGVSVRGHVKMHGHLEVRMVSPFDCAAELHYGFFNRPPSTLGGIRAHAAVLLRREYRRIAAEKAEKSSRSREEWGALAAQTKRRISAMNRKILLIRRMIISPALEDYRNLVITQAEYMRIFRSYKERIRSEVAKLEQLIVLRQKALRYAEDFS